MSDSKRTEREERIERINNLLGFIKPLRVFVDTDQGLALEDMRGNRLMCTDIEWIHWAPGDSSMKSSYGKMAEFIGKEDKGCQDILMSSITHWLLGYRQRNELFT